VIFVGDAYLIVSAGALGLLFAVLGVFPALAGLGVMLLLLPFNLVMVRYLTVIRKRLIAWTDQRVKLVTEVIHGIKAIKLYAWEEPFMDRVKALRAKEVKEVRTSVYFGEVWGLGGLVVSGFRHLTACSGMKLFAWREPLVD
jgi:ABC-type bacteriocin/lantibiotic exporter with double-glycine peptidase domain